MLELNRIPSDEFIAAKKLADMGMSYSELKAASQFGGVLERKVETEKGKPRVYYKSKNLRLF